MRANGHKTGVMDVLRVHQSGVPTLIIHSSRKTQSKSAKNEAMGCGTMCTSKYDIYADCTQQAPISPW